MKNKNGITLEAEAAKNGLVFSFYKTLFYKTLF